VGFVRDLGRWAACSYKLGELRELSDELELPR
jgi:hypothetical protein